MKFRKKPVVVEAEQWEPGKRVEDVTEMVYAVDGGRTESGGYGTIMMTTDSPIGGA